MTRILFICHGNICRSTMAEFVMKELVRQHHCADAYEIASAATSQEEIGNDTHWGTKEQLDFHHIPYAPRKARQMTPGIRGILSAPTGMWRKGAGACCTSSGPVNGQQPKNAGRAGFEQGKNKPGR